MEQIFDGLMNSLQNQKPILLYGFLFLSAIVENLFPPVPGDTVTVFGAFLVGTGKLSFIPVFVATTIGSSTGFFLLYVAARYFEAEIIKFRVFKWLDTAKLEAAKKKLGKYGYVIIAANRFLPGIRSIISVTSGIIQMKPLPVFLLSFASAAAWNLLWIETGFLLGNNWETVKSQLTIIVGRYNLAVGIIICVAVAAFIIYKIYKLTKDRNRKHRKR